MAQAVLDALQQKHPTAIREVFTVRGDEVAMVNADDIATVCSFLKYDPAMDMKLLLSVTAVDYLGWEEAGSAGRRAEAEGRSITAVPRFEVVYHLTSMTHHHRVRLRAKVTEKPGEIPTVSGIWRTANWWERHVWDLYGLRFKGHPDMRRLYMPEDWDGHPLRKDYPLRGRHPIVPERDIPDLIRGPGPQPRDFDKTFPGRAPRR
jgi:NADH-quinone oxidoreductase subunit C